MSKCLSLAIRESCSFVHGSVHETDTGVKCFKGEYQVFVTRVPYVREFHNLILTSIKENKAAFSNLS